MKLFLGIDPGMGGALAIVNADGQFITATSTPVIGKVPDTKFIRDWLTQQPITAAILEQVASRPGQGVSTMFKFGRVYGLAEGLLAGLQIPYSLVTPHTWTKTMHLGVEGRDDMEAKEASRVAAMRLFPQADFRASPRCTNPHDGKIDAALLAEFCRRRFFSTAN